MHITLNTDKSSFCTIGTFSFTFLEPGPQYVDLEQLTSEEIQQIYYNIKRNVLKTDDVEKLETSLGIAKKPQYVTPNEVPITTPLKMDDRPSLEAALEEDQKELKKILAGVTSSIKKQASSMRPGRLRKLLELEKKNKKRVGVIAFLTETVNQHVESVQNVFQGEDLIPEDGIKLSELSTQLEDIVESDVEEVILKIPTEDSNE
jgi:hypothetical protein